ncbi:MAG: hypothetical protein QNK05_19365 [Myxococcota bacterium]|nr:hypothetical protein [Myxococcota bacterium]
MFESPLSSLVAAALGGVVFLLVLGLAPSARADVPAALSLQGQLVDPTGVPYSGTVDLVLGIWVDPLTTDPGDRLYQEEHLGVALGDGGVFDVSIGTGTPLDGSFRSDAFDRHLFVEIEVDGELLSPRMALTSAPYAFQADDAGSLGGRRADEWQPKLKGDCQVGSFVIGISPEGILECAPGGAGATATASPLVGDGSDAQPVSLQPGGVTGAYLANDSVDASKIVNFSVGTAEVAPGAIQSAHIADGGVNSNDILNESITASDIQVGAVRSSEIMDGQVKNADLATNSVTASKIATNAVGPSEIASNAVGADEIEPSAVGSSELQNASVGFSELKNGAVGNSKLGLGISHYSWTASNNSQSYQGSLGSHNFCAVTGVFSGGPTSGTNIRHVVCATYQSSINPANWIIEAHGTVLTTCNVKCF